MGGRRKKKKKKKVAVVLAVVVRQGRVARVLGRGRVCRFGAWPASGRRCRREEEGEEKKKMLRGEGARSGGKAAHFVFSHLPRFSPNDDGALAQKASHQRMGSR